MANDPTVKGLESLGAQHPFHLPRMAEIVAAKLRERIIAGSLADGDELPRESDMLATTGVSRPTLREALRILETEGLVRIRRGKVGGAVVSRPTVESAAYHVGLTLQSNAVTLADLATARQAIQPACAALAAAQPNCQEIAEQLTALIDESEGLSGDAAGFMDSAQRFHTRLIELCGNTTMALVAGTLEAVWAHQERGPLETAPETVDPSEFARIGRASVKFHKQVVRHIANADSDGAARAMRKHLAHSQESTLHQYGDGSMDIGSARRALTPRTSA